MKSFILIAVFIFAVWLGATRSRAQTDDSVSATIKFGNGDNVSITDFSNSINVQPNEVVNVTIQFAAADVGEMFKVEVPDGGSVSLGSNVVVVGENRSVTFGLRAPTASGQNAVTVQSASKSFSLQFSVADSSGS